MISSIPLSSLDKFGWNPPINSFADPYTQDFIQSPSAARFRSDFGENRFLDALLVSKQSSILVVSFHGAINRQKVSLPRFERLATLKHLNVSSMYFGDPGMWTSDSLSISWYTGWLKSGVQETIATEISRAASRLGCQRIVIVGDSGGGFAALQISALIAGSLCVAFNPTTTLHNYFDGGNTKRTVTQEKYISTIIPEILPRDGNFDPRPDWSLRLSTDYSALHRYSKRTENWVLFLQNVNDWHYKQHYLPFLGAAAKGNNLFRVQTMEYFGKRGHSSPSKELYESGLEAGLNISSLIEEGVLFHRFLDGSGMFR